jgi:hypothetical protein
VRGKAYHLIAQPAIQQRLQLPPDQVTVHPESGASRALYDCGPIQLAPAGPVMRMLLATHPAGASCLSVGTVRKGVVYEQFFTTLPSPAFTPADVLDLYLHRGSFETVLSDEDEEQATDRWVSRTQWGQEFWQIINQWIWNLRLELGQHAQATTMRVTDLAYSQVQKPSTPPPDDDPPPDGTPPPVPPGTAPPSAETAPVDPAPSSAAPETTGSAETSQDALDWLASYGPPKFAQPSFTHGFPGSAFTPQPDGTLRCPAGHPLYLQERRPERNGSLRVLYAARIGHCRPCPLREQCQESGSTKKPRRVSAVFWPRTYPPPGGAALASKADQASPPAEQASAFPPIPAQPVRWGDWPRCQIRRTFVQLLRTQAVLISVGATETLVPTKPHSPPLETRVERAHWRLSWAQRLTRNARPSTAPSVEIVLHGLSAPFIQAFDFPLRPAAWFPSGPLLPVLPQAVSLRPFACIHASLLFLLLPHLSLTSSCKLTKENRERGRIEGMRRPLFLLISSSKTHETWENPRVKLSPEGESLRATRWERVESNKLTKVNVRDGKNDKQNGIQASLWSVWENRKINQNALLWPLDMRW